jgi:hypothetical protein
MARYNEILVGRYNNALRKMFGMKGPAPAPQAAGEFAPTLSFFYGVENRFLEEWQRFANFQAVAAGGATFNSAIRYRNPAGSNVIAVIEKLSMTSNVASQIRVEVRTVNTDLGVVSAMPNTRFDNRGRPAPTLINSTQNNAIFAVTVIMWLTITPATAVQLDVIQFEDHELTLLPGDSLTIVESNSNTPLNAGIFWRERFLEDTERQ